MFGDWLGLLSGFIAASPSGSPRAPLHLKMRAKRIRLTVRTQVTER